MQLRRIPLLLTMLALLVAPSLFAEGGWNATSAGHRGENGRRFRYSCSPGGRLGNVWGTEIYTDDSSVCSAAVHAGVINIDDGGVVVIEIRPGRRSYSGSYRNGVRSKSFDNWLGSFTFVGESAEREQPRDRERPRDGDRDERRRPRIDWSTKANVYRGEEGRRFTVDCPGGGHPYSIWGSGTYTDDSSVCTAAVHRGLIGWDGGRVTIEIRPGRDSYRGSRRNGVESHNYGSWTGSFVFVE